MKMVMSPWPGGAFPIPLFTFAQLYSGFIDSSGVDKETLHIINNITWKAEQEQSRRLRLIGEVLVYQQNKFRNNLSGRVSTYSSKIMAGEVVVDALPYIDQGYDEAGVREAVRNCRDPQDEVRTLSMIEVD